MRARSLATVALICGAMAALPILHQSWSQTQPMPTSELRPASSFANISDERARSAALFQEASKVLMHPRCVNCHPASDRPNQTDSGRPHQPLVVRGKDGYGATAMACSTCHGKANFEASKVRPVTRIGISLRPRWRGKASRSARFVSKSRIPHVTTVWTCLSWSIIWLRTVWSAGPGRRAAAGTPAPGTQAEFGALMRAWAETGAYCPAP